MRYVALNATKPATTDEDVKRTYMATTDEDVKRTYIVRILNPSLFYFLLCLAVFTFYYASFIYTLYYASFISTLYYASFICTFSCADPFFDIWRDGASVPTPGGVQEGPSDSNSNLS
jgi:hypothetical protein